MSSYQNLQFLVQFTYDAKSLKDIQDKANNLQVKPVKIKFDTKEAEKQISDLSKKILEQTQKLADAKKKLSEVQQQQPKAQTGTTGQKQAQQEVATAQAQLTQSTNALAAAQARQSAQTGTIVDQYQRQTTGLMQLQGIIQGYQKELKELAQKKKEQGSLSLEEEKRANALVLAIEQTKKAYQDKKQAIVESTQTTERDAQAVSQTTQALQASYTSQIAKLAEYRREITNISAQLRELEKEKKRDGSLSEESQSKYEALQLQLKSTKTQYGVLQKQVQQTRQEQEKPVKTQAQEKLEQQQRALSELQKISAVNADKLLSKYQSQATELVALQDKISAYKRELQAIQAVEKSGAQLTDEQKARQEGLRTALAETQKAYADTRAFIVANTQATQQDKNTVSESTRVLRESYSSQLQVLASYKSEITAISAQLKDLDKAKRTNGQLTDEEKSQYEALSLRLKSVKGDYTALQKEVQKSQAKQPDPAIVKQNEKVVESQQKLAQVQRERAKSDDVLLRSYQKQSMMLRDLQKRLDEYKTEIQLLQTIQKQGGSLDADQQARLEALKLAYKEVSKDIAQATRDAVSQERATRNAGTSYNDLQQRMAALSVEIRNTQDPLGKNREAVARMTKEYDTLNTKLKTIDSAMGNQQRNVGNYTDSIRAAANALAVVQGPLGPLAGRLNSLATTIGRINEMTGKKKVNLNEVKITTEAYNGTLGTFRAALMGNVPLIGHFNRGIQAQAVVAQQGSRAIKILSGTLAILKTALAATGIGLLVVGLTSLVSFFKRTEKGAQALRVIMAGVSAVVETLRARSIELGERIFNAFKNPQQAIKDLGNFIVQNLINRVKAVGDLFLGVGKIIMSTLKLDAEGMKEGAAEVGNALVQVTTGVEDAGESFGKLKDEIEENVKAMTKEQKQLNVIKVALREMNVERAKGALEVQKARALARDATVSYEEQIEALERIKKAEEDRFARELKINEDRLRIAKEQLARFPSDEKAIEEVAQAEIALANLKKEFFTQEIRLFRDIDSRKRAMRERENRELREAQKIREGLAEVTRSIDIAELRRMGHKHAALLEERRFLQDQDRINTLISEKAREIMNQEGENYSEVKAKQRAEALIKADVEKELAQNYLQLLDLQYNAEQEMINQRMSLRQMERQAELDDQLRFFTNRNDAVSAAEARRNSIVEKYNTERDLMIQKRADELYRKTQDRAFAQAQAEREIRLQQQQELASAEQAIQDAKRDYNVKTIDTIQNAAIKGAEAIFGQNKAIQSAAVVVDTLKGAQRALTENPPPSPIGIASAAAVVAQGAIALRKINATKKGDKSVGSAGAGANIPTEAFGLVDANKLILPNEIASQLASQQPQVTNNIILEGELDSELLAIKVRDGNNTISAQTVSV